MGEFQSFNLGRWLRQLGVKNNAEPDFVYNVQPTHLLGDASEWVPSMATARAFFGQALGAPGATNFPCIRVRAIDGEGVFVPNFRINKLAGVNADELGMLMSNDATGIPTLATGMGGGGVQTANDYGPASAGTFTAAIVELGGLDLLDARVLVAPKIPLQQSPQGIQLFCPVGNTLDIFVAEGNVAADCFVQVEARPGQMRGT